MQSFIIGLAIAAPIGPIGVLCIQRTLTHGMLRGFVSGMGAATADAFYGCLIAFGFSALSNLLLEVSGILNLLGALFLFYLGIRILRSSTSPNFTEDYVKEYGGLLRDYLTTFMLTLANPLTILAFIGIFSGIDRDMTGSASWVTVLGVFAGSAGWWLTLSGSVGLLRARIKPDLFIWINRLSGCVIILFALRVLLG